MHCVCVCAHTVSVSVLALCLCLRVCLCLWVWIVSVCVFALCVSVQALCLRSYLVFDRRRSCFYPGYHTCAGNSAVYYRYTYMQRLYYYQMCAWSGVGHKLYQQLPKSMLTSLCQRHCEQLVQSLLWWCSQKMRARTTDVEFTELSLHPRENYLLCMFFAQITFTHNGL